jgi:hypothetical protein
MRWFRANKTFGSRLALFGLAVQIVLSFGHVHLDGIGGKARSVAAANSLSVPLADTRDKNPAHRRPGVDDYCAICASIHLAGTALATAAPQLTLPAVSQRVDHSDYVAFVIVSPRRSLFQSRAPPVA